MNWWDIPLAGAAVYVFGVFVLATGGTLAYGPDLSDQLRRKVARVVFDAWKWPVTAAKLVRARWAKMRADARHENADS